MIPHMEKHIEIKAQDISELSNYLGSSRHQGTLKTAWNI